MNLNSRINLMQLFALSIYFFTLVLYVKTTDFFEGLNFTQKHHNIVNIRKKVLSGEKTIGNDMATACPVQFPEEKKFNSKYSFGKNSLFVRSVYTAEQNPIKVDDDICTDIYQVSIIYSRPTGIFKFGYEIYYDSSEFKGLKNSNYDDFDSITKAYSSRRHWARKIGLVRSKPVLKKEYGPAVPLHFVWITLSELVFHNRITRVSRVSYRLSKNMEIGAKCRNYIIGNELYLKKKIDVNSLYKNQAEIFKMVKLPELDSGCEKRNRCLAKWSLLTPDRFRTRSPEPFRISCSNLATVAIWKRITDGVLRKLEKFLTVLTFVVYADLKITSGAFGKLLMPTTQSRKSKKISLLNNGEIPVPNIIYKVVKYEFIAEEKAESTAHPVKSTISKAVIIVIHNDPYFDRKDALCLKENCEKWGWGEILNENIPSEGTSSNYVYCCPKNKEIMNKLDMGYDDKEAEVLSLIAFPKYDKVSQKIENESIELDIVTKMTKLAKAKIKKKKIIRLGVIDEEETEDENADIDYSKNMPKIENGKPL